MKSNRSLRFVLSIALAVPAAFLAGHSTAHAATAVEYTVPLTVNILALL